MRLEVGERRSGGRGPAPAACEGAWVDCGPDRRPMSDRRVPVAAILLEASFVVLGVFLALVANEWRAGVAARDRAETAHAGIVDEVRANREAVQASHDYHVGLLDSLRARHEAGVTPKADVFSQGFVRPATTLSTAWDAATATDAVAAMDYDEVLAFSELYAHQERYQTTARQAGTVIYQAVFELGVPGVAERSPNLTYTIGSFVYLERGLLAEYDDALAAIGEPARE